MAGGEIGGAEEAVYLTAELGKTLKEGERILAPTRRPDGTLRKPIRIRAGYVPQDEVAIYQSKGSLWKKEMAATQAVPPGYDPVGEAKPKSKSAKRNERKKEKRQQAALDRDMNDCWNNLPENIDLVASKMDEISITGNASLVTPPPNPTDCSTAADQIQDIDKKIRALKKKIRLTEAQQQKTAENDLKSEQLEKMAKLEDWRNDLKRLEGRKAELMAPLS